MKKYTIKDNLGNKKTIYAKDLAHALRLNDDDYLGLVKINGRTMYLRHHKSVVGPEWWGITPDKWGDNPKKKFKSKAELDKYLKSVGAITDSKVKDDTVSNYFYFDLDDLGMSLDNAVNIMKNCGLTIVKIDKRSKEAKVYYRGTSAAEQKAADKLDISLDDSINDSIKDEANLPTTIQALVNDEEAAIKAYEVAIKNLEGKIDETQMQVLINIMKDERRHVENLYAILNGQITEKNLEDSIHDSSYDTDEIDRFGNKFRNLSREYSSKLRFKANGRFTHIEGKKSDIEDFLDDYFGPNMGPYSIRG